MSLQPVPHTVDELETRVREGLPMSALRACVARATESAGARQALLAQIIPEISNNHQGGTLSRVESEKTERVARVVATASYVWNDEAAVQGFLETPHPSLDGRIPLNVALTELGARRIEDLLWKLFYEKPV
ncbi:antitoxin Xre/MbcA/ParS toxin-binding domain-containing protein [Paraburkholderia sp. C35]|uniref:antitoxin Xre/MbcA/ParS toxin-binding domain-containing protein n=1 Tax=Paraburkholderia sp. C35 TaxID=2126993 RepID=UPI0019526488|nr:antitoxin Xre/MbcA/ParS toxin-binding domain-containing protein [Paraburkholderia sp. C35]